MKQNTKAAAKRTTATSFGHLQKIYGVTTPEQIKLRIIWQHIQALTLKVHGNTPENLTKLNGYDRAFAAAEYEENKRVRAK